MIPITILSVRNANVGKCDLLCSNLRLAARFLRAVSLTKEPLVCNSLGHALNYIELIKGVPKNAVLKHEL